MILRTHETLTENDFERYPFSGRWMYALIAPHIVIEAMKVGDKANFLGVIICATPLGPENFATYGWSGYDSRPFLYIKTPASLRSRNYQDALGWDHVNAVIKYVREAKKPNAGNGQLKNYDSKIT